MKRFTQREIFGICIVLLVGLLALGFWRAFFDTSLRPDVHNTLSVLLWFLFLGMGFFLGTVVWQHWGEQSIGSILILLPSLLFVQVWYHGAFLILASLLIFSATRSVQREITDRVRFHFIRSARVGSFLFVFGLSLVLGSAYFSSIRAESWEALVPRFSVGEGTASLLIKTVAYLYPQWKDLADEGMTVDGFLRSLKKNDGLADQPLPESVQRQLGGAAASQALSQYLKQSTSRSNGDAVSPSEELALEAGREQIALLVGRPVRGSEKITDVFSLAIQHKIIAALSGEQASQHFSPTIVPVILSLLLFFTLLPVGSGVAFVSIGGSLLLFRIALVLHWLRLEREMREQDILLP